MIECEREAGGLAPDTLVLRSGESDRIGASHVSALTEVRVHRTLEPLTTVGVVLRPLVHLAEDRLVDGLLSSIVSHRDARRGRPMSATNQEHAA